MSSKFTAFRDKYGISAAALKWIAAVSMLVDHTGATVVNHLKYSPVYAYDVVKSQQLALLYKYMRRFGRIAFPLYCFMLVEGYFHTRNVKRYAGRLFIFALISEFPFDFALHHGQPFLQKQNVYFTLLMGLLVIWLVDDWLRGRIAMQLIVMIVSLFFIRFLRTDYNYHGVFLIELLYITHFIPRPEPGTSPVRFWQGACSAAYLEYYEKMPTPIAGLLMVLYNGKRGWQPKIFFYFFYPLHLMVLGLITFYLLPAIGI